ncbi:acetyltransferase [Raphidocelis subcapitata]|uniref:Acetyltransferase n=1 Tax=Raphidocelis subcapitata TaxID=307507 RepID=A0A2V0PBQ7_9CHLO|nr:acetyltransferase [Raphidocelis subcapitata]|eukprot:GBF96969.1 acetyltransferase [Raphidocelis subcapitata]
MDCARGLQRVAVRAPLASRPVPRARCRCTAAAPAAAARAPGALKVPSKPRLTFVGFSGAVDGASGRGPHSWLRQRLSGVLPLPPITRSDEEFRQAGVEFLSTANGICVAELCELFDKVGFPRRDPERLKVALCNTHRMVWARATRQSGNARRGELLGIARATSDGALTATVWDVAVTPSWQRAGLGRGLMERLTRALVEDGIPSISLYAEPQVVELYKRLGFKEDGVRPLPVQTFRKAAPALPAGQQAKQQPCLAGIVGGGRR